LEVTQVIDLAEHVPHVLDIAHLGVDNSVAIPVQCIMLRVSADQALERRREGLIMVPAQELHEGDVKRLASRRPFQLLDGLLVFGRQLRRMAAAIPLPEKALRRENFLALDAILRRASDFKASRRAFASVGAKSGDGDVPSLGEMSASRVTSVPAASSVMRKAEK
jgi:hypothetical protein